MFDEITSPRHTFELSGLVKTPYSVINGKQQALKKGHPFNCEHCGTTIKKSHFIKSMDGKVFIVGIDCLRKSGDKELLDGINHSKREAKLQEREVKLSTLVAPRNAHERHINHGQTNLDRAVSIENEIEGMIRRFMISLDNNPIVSVLDGFGFSQDMAHQAYLVRPYTAAQLSALKKVYTNKVTNNARIDDAVYKAAEPVCHTEVDTLQASILNCYQELEEMRYQAKKLRYG